MIELGKFDQRDLVQPSVEFCHHVDWCQLDLHWMKDISH